MDLIYNQKLQDAQSRILGAKDEELFNKDFPSTVAKEVRVILPSVSDSKTTDVEETQAQHGNVPPGSMWTSGAMVSIAKIGWPVNDLNSRECQVLLGHMVSLERNKFYVSDGKIVYQEIKMGQISKNPQLADSIKENAKLRIDGVKRVFNDFEESAKKFTQLRLVPFINQKVEEERNRRNGLGNAKKVLGDF